MKLVSFASFCSTCICLELHRVLHRKASLEISALTVENFLLHSSSGADPDFYANIPYSLPDPRLLKSPHALWGTLPTSHLSRAANDGDGNSFTHPLLRKFVDPSF